MTSKNLRIISLLPAATEIVYLLDLDRYLVGVSDECDFPTAVLSKPKIVQSLISNDLSSRKINDLVSVSSHQGLSIAHLDSEKLRELKPNLILTQELCEVCAIPFTQVKKTARYLEGDINILSLEPHAIKDMLENILEVGKITGKEKKAHEEIKKLQQRVEKVKKQVKKNKPTVLIIEWLDPIYIAAHWVPEMVEIAGGEMVIGEAGKKSQQVSWEEIVKLNPDILIFAPCGFSIERTKEEMHLFEKKKEWNDLVAIKNKRVHLLDGNAYFTRPGPRLVEGIEILSRVLH